MLRHFTWCLILFVHAAAAFDPPAKVRVVTDRNFPPFLFQTEDGKLQGILKDRWDLWSAKTGVAVQLQGMEWAAAQEAVLSGRADVIEVLAYTEARTEAYEFSKPYAPIEARVFFHHSISGINDAASMRGFAIGAKAGSACGSWLLQRGVRVVEPFPDSESLVRAAAAGEVRLFCMDVPTADYFLFKLGLADEFRESPPLYVTQYHWAVKKGRVELRDFIQSGFDAIPAAQLQELDTRWQGSPVRFPIGARYFYIIGGVTAALLTAAGLLVAWNRGLRRRVALRTAELTAAVDSLRRQSERIRDLYNNAPCGYHSLGTDGIVVEINDTELRWLGRTREEVVGRRYSEFLAPAARNRFPERMARFLESGVASELEAELIRRDGSRVTVLLSSTAVRAADGKILHSRSTTYDITARKQAEEEVRKLNAELEARVGERTAELAAANADLRVATAKAQSADQVKSAFLATMSHELRTPLNSIIGFTGILLQGLAGPLNPEQSKQLGMVQGSGRHLLALINDVLDISKIEAGELTVSREPFDLGALLSKVAETVRPLAHKKGLGLRVAGPQCLALVGDARRVEQVLLNLLNNAVKFTDHGEVVLTVDASDETVSMRVTDTGIGIKPEDMKTLFQPFRQVASTLSRVHEGTGLGLAICRRLAELMGGEIHAESEWAKGSTFSFTLPRTARVIAGETA